ncbi:MAG: cytochrome c [Acidiferrobacterales bacterium]
MKILTTKLVYQLAFIASVSILAACEKPTPQQIQAKLHLPKEKVTRNIGLGKSIYRNSCSSCHGIGTKGTLKGPPLVYRTYRPSHHSDMAFHLAVKNGVKQHHWNFGHMPPVENLTPEQVEHLIGYVRDEQRRAGIQ